MTRKLSVLIIVLALAMLFTGCCKHEVWTEANCTTPRTCVECGEVDGEALGHIWQPRTTEVPETCSRCSETRGERIITDPRFTTASTIDYYGTWKGHSSISGQLVDEDLHYLTMPVDVTMTLYNDSTLKLEVLGTNTAPFVKAAEEHFHKKLEAEAAGLKQFTFAEYMAIVYECTPDEYVEQQLSKLDLTSLTQGHTIDGVYYIDGDQFYIGLGWEADPVPFTFQHNGGTMILHGDISGLGQQLTNLSHVSHNT